MINLIKMIIKFEKFNKQINPFRIKMILGVFVWIRLAVVMVIWYLFFYEYLFKKYSSHLNQFDQFNWRNAFSNQQSMPQLFNFTQKQINGYALSVVQNNRPLCHVGLFSEFNNGSFTQQYQKDYFTTQYKNSEFQLNPFVQKIDSYQFNFYNWYRFQITFTDIGHDSYFQFRLTQNKKGSHQIFQKIGFKLPQNFYPLTEDDQNNRLNINFNAKGISLNVSQYTVPGRYNDPESDGLQQQRFFHLTQNKTVLTQEEYIKFGSPKTFTQFNFTLQRNDYEIKAYATHLIRHNQCLTSYQNGKLRHKCMGGYGKGKLSFSQFIRQDINLKQKRYTGSWQRNSFNLDNSRVRTTFIGQRYSGKTIDKFIPSISFSQKQQYRSVQVDFIGFNKLEYYAKEDKIQKQRWVGMSLYQLLDNNGAPILDTIHQNHFFINGNIHRIHNIDFSLPLNLNKLQKGQTIVFKNDVKNKTLSNLTPSFNIEFQISNSTLVEQNGVLNQKKIYRIDGYWKGWIDEGSLFEDEKIRNHFNQTYEYGYVEFYEIMGTIKFVQYID